MALGYLWEGLCAPHPAQTYISLISLIDSLVGTRNAGGHVLAERVATVLGTDAAARQPTYDEIVKLYGIRNRLVHGSAHPRKGKQSIQSLSMGAKRSSVPHDDMAKLVLLCIRLIRRCLEDREYLSTVQAKGKESKVDEKLATLFMNRLFGAS